MIQSFCLVSVMEDPLDLMVWILVPSVSVCFMKDQNCFETSHFSADVSPSLGLMRSSTYFQYAFLLSDWISCFSAFNRVLVVVLFPFVSSSGLKGQVSLYHGAASTFTSPKPLV